MIFYLKKLRTIISHRKFKPITFITAHFHKCRRLGLVLYSNMDLFDNKIIKVYNAIN